MRQRGFAHILVLIIVIVLAVGGIGYYAYKNGQIRFNNPVEFIDQNITPTPDPTINWNTFINSKFNYQFKYPPEWEINRGPGELSDEDLGKGRSIDLYSGRSSESTYMKSLGLAFAIETNELAPKGDERICSTLENCITQTTSFFPQEVERTEETFQNQKGIRITFDRETSLYTQTFSHLFVILNEDFYHFTMTVQNGDFSQNKYIFDQILSTFKFTE